MNREEFQARYELIEQVTEGIIESHHALHHSGVVVMVHEVGGTPDFQDRVEAAVRRTGGAPPDGQLLEIHNIDDRRVIVTRFLMDFWNLERWAGLDETESEQLQAPESLHAEGSPDPAPPPQPGGTEAPGEFTRMFQIPLDPMNPSPVSDPPQSDPSPPPAPPAAPASAPPAPAASDSGPGEFTRMFARPEIPPVDTPPSPPAPDPGSVPFQGGAPPPDAGPPADDGPGDFTRMFQAQSPPASPPQAPRVDSPVPPPPAPPPPPFPAEPTAPPPPGLDDGPGEFTRFFQAPKPPPTPSGPPGLEGLTPTRKAPGISLPPDTAADPSWSDALRESRPRDPNPPAALPPDPAAPAAPGPSDLGGFTQMFGAQQRPAAPPGAQAPGVSEPAAVGGTPPAPPTGPPASADPPSSGGGVNMPRGLDPESLLRRRRVPRPRTPRVRVPPMNARRAAKAAFSVAGALQSRGSDPEAGDDGAMDADAGAEPKKPLSKGLIIGLVAVVVLVLTLLAFFLFWDFSGGPTGEGDGTQDPVPVETGGGAEVSAPSSSGA